MRIIIIDDDPIVCQSLAAIASMGAKKEGGEPIDVIATGNDAHAAVALYEREKPDIILLDIQMPGNSGLDACREILAGDPHAKILFLTTFLDEEYILQALRLGAKGYLVKTSVEAVVPALYAIAKGQHVYGDEIARKLPDLLSRNAANSAVFTDAPTADPFQALSAREKGVLHLLAEGKNNREIAQALHYSEGTVRNYLSTILEKTGLRDRTQLAIAYYKAQKS